MGHVRLGKLLKTKPWKKVIDLIANGADAAQVANATVVASEKALLFVQEDTGFKEAVHLMVQLGLAGSKPDLAGYLGTVGIHLPNQATVLDVALAVHQAVERNLGPAGQQTAFGEKARSALVGAVTEYLDNRLGTLVSANSGEVIASLQGLRTVKNFSELGRLFFAKLTHGSMQYFLSKTLATHIGAGQRFATTTQMDQFERSMETHCNESSVIVESYCGEWLSKHRFEEGGTISRESMERFGWYAMEKMRKEFTFETKPNEQ